MILFGIISPYLLALAQFDLVSSKKRSGIVIKIVLVSLKNLCFFQTLLTMLFSINLSLVDILVFFTTLILIAYVYFKYKFSYWKRKGVTSLEPTVPFGNLKPLVLQKQSVGEVVKDIYFELKKRGCKYGGFYSLTKPTFVALDLDLIKLILTKEFQSFHDRDIYCDEENEPLTGNLLFLPGVKWRNLRNKLSPTFTSGKMKMMFPTFLACGQQLTVTLAQVANDTDAMDMKDVLARFTTDVIGSCAFGIECNSLKDPNSEFRKYGKMIFVSTLRDSLVRMLAFASSGIVRLFKLKFFRPELSEFFFNAIKETIDYREKHNIDRKDFMSLLIRLKNNQSVEDDKMDSNVKIDATENFTLNELTAQAFVFFFAGFETSSSTMTLALYELAQNQPIQDKLRKDIDMVLKNHNGKMTYEAFMDMKYLDQVIKETLRKYPIAPLLNRKCTQDFKVPNTDLTIEKGSVVFIPVMGIQRDPEYYPDPLKFDPERFDESKNLNRNPYTYMAFGEGPRHCIGMRFGLLQTKVGLVTLLQNYKFFLNPKTKQPLRFDPANFILINRDTIWFKIQKV